MVEFKFKWKFDPFESEDIYGTTVEPQIEWCWIGEITLVFYGLFFATYFLRPSFSGRSFKLKKKSTVLASCPRCSCDCPSELDSLSFSPGCTSDDVEMNEEMKKDVTLISEEIRLQKNLTLYRLKHTQALTMHTKRTLLQYQKEAQKCYAMMNTCEDAREKAEAALVEEHKYTALWEE